jgi:hypothetical protein
MTRSAKLCALVAAAFTLGCQRGVPPDPANNNSDRQVAESLSAAVNAIEARSGNIPCVGGLNKWERQYAFSKADANKVEFVYREAGKFGFVAGRTLLLTNSLYEIDDRPYLTLHGSFDISKAKLNVDYCGLNAPAVDERGPT